MINLRDRVDLLLRVAFGVLILVGCYFVISPFITSILLAAILAVVSWPFFEWLNDRFNGHSTLASSVMVLLIIVTILIPLTLVCMVLARQIPDVVYWVRDWIHAGMPLPNWLLSIPYLGQSISDAFKYGIDPEQVRTFIEKAADPLTKSVLSVSWGIGNGLFQLALVAFIVFFFYRDGPSLSKKTGMFINRISGGLATEFTAILVNTTRSVVFGVIGTAIGQGLVAAVGFIIAGVPGVVILSFTVCVLSIVPVGPPLVWGPVALWLYATGNVGMAVFMVLWGTLAVSSVDNFIKPILISRGTSMPLALVFLGVFGGIMSFGFLGLVLGPVLLAATLALFKEWTKNPIRIDKAIARVQRLKKDLTETAEDPDEAAKGGHHKAIKDESSQPQN